MDETYAEDSFVVGSDEEEPNSNEEEAEDVELMPEVSYVDGRRQYATRRRIFLHKARAVADSRADCPSKQRATAKAKRSRVIPIIDSSEEEMDEGSKNTNSNSGGSATVLQPNKRHQEKTAPSPATLASKVSLLNKAQSSLSAEQTNER